MSKIITQSLFTANEAEKRSWQSWATSVAIHGAVIAALLLITFPAVEQFRKPEDHVSLVAPVLPTYKPKVIPQPVPRQKIVLKQTVRPVVQPKKFVPPPPVKLPEVKPVQIAKAPEIKVQPTVQHAPEIKVEAPALPKPPVKTGVFESQELAKGPKVSAPLKVGGFGDPNGAHPADDARQGRLQMAKVGSFDLPAGAGQGGGGGHSQAGSVRASGFGSPGDPSGVPGGTGVHGSVRTGAFGDTATPARTTQLAQVQAPPSTTPVEILFKPKPAYTAEAKQLGLEGQVAIQVVFTASGEVKVMRIVRGLGHGLDEAAQQAALQVRFRPATRGGTPVDTTATIYITFQLS